MKMQIRLLALLFILLHGAVAQTQHDGANFRGLVTLSNSGASNGLTPRIFSVQDGSSTTYLTGLTALTPSMNVTLWNGTPQFQAGYGVYAQRIDLVTKAATNVQSSVGLGVIVTSHATNSGGAATYNNTTHVGILGNSSAVDSTASASVVGINAISGTSYTGIIPQHVIGFESDVLSNRDGTPEGGTTGPYAIGGLFSNNSTNGSQTDGTFGVMARGVDANDSWKTAGFFSGRNCGVCVGTENGVTPDVAYWARSAVTWGFYVGSRAIQSSSLFNSTMTLANPAVGIELGEKGATTQGSNSLRFSSRDGSSVQHTWDFSSDSANTLLIKADAVATINLTTGGNLQVKAQVTPITAGGTTIGATSLPYSSVFIGNAATNNFQVTGTATAARVTTLPDGSNSTVLVGSFTTTATTTDNVTIQGMTASGHCMLEPTNSGAAGGIASVFVSAKASNQITVTHTATSGWTFDVMCTGI